MKLFFKVLGGMILTIAAIAYLAFIFYLPHAIDLNAFKPDIQKLAKEQANLNVNYENLHIITDPLLRVGIMADNISVNLPDGSVLFTANYFKGKLSLPNLLLLTVKAVGVEIDNPFINLEVVDSRQLKVVQLVEDIINTQKQTREEKAEIPAQDNVPFDISMIKIKVPNVKINDYKVLVYDLKARHTLTLCGEEMLLSYLNGKTFKLKTNAALYSDKDKNITANINLDGFIPPAQKLDEDDDEAQRVELPQINPVQLYRDYNLKSNINMKIKARNDKKLHLHGFANIDNTTISLSGFALPESYLKMKFRGNTADMDTNLYVTPDENIQLKGIVNYTGKPFINLKILTSKIYFNDVIILAKAFADTLNIKNDLASISGKGYIHADTVIKTDLKKLKSQGSIVVRDGSIVNNKIGLGFNKINSNLIFADNKFKVTDTHMFVNNSALNIEGSIDDKSIADISIFAQALPLPELFLAFAPADLQKSYNLNSGNLSVDVKILGELKKAVSTIQLSMKNLSLSDKKNTLVVTNENTKIDLASNFKTIGGKIVNNNFKLSLPPTDSVIADDLLTINIDEENINIVPTNIKVNTSSLIKFKGSIKDYMKNPYINMTADGKMHTVDLKKLAGSTGDIFLKSQGKIPVKMSLKGNAKRQSLVLQVMADKINHITPVDIQSMLGKQSILQAKIDFKGDRLRIKDTGLFTKEIPTGFTEDLISNMQGAKEVLGISGTITGLDKSVPFINLIKITIPQEINAVVCAFKNSVLKLNGNMIVFGNLASPRTRGHFQIHDSYIPDLLTTLQTADFNFANKRLDIAVNNLNLNESDIGINTTVELIPSNIVNISNLSVNSNRIDLDKLMQVSEAAMGFVPSSPTAANAQPSDIPVHIRRGNIDLRQIKTGDITAYNTTGNIALRNNVFYLNRLATRVFNGNVSGNVSANLLTLALRLRLHGANFDVENTLYDLMKMKDTLSGMLAFDTDLTMDGSAKTQLDQMKSIKGSVDFVIEDGQLGPFGRLENLILAENIRESEFFQTTIGSVINSMTTIKTSHFEELTGHLMFDNGIVTLDPITSLGEVMCLHIGGTMNLLTNEADMKLRGRLGSTVSNMLGPLAAVNPINLVKVTPGLNIMAAKAFQFFCETITQEEMDAIPDFTKDFNSMSTTKFQVILRGDTTKPLTLVKSFKWLALASDVVQAQAFVSSLPEPELEPTPEQIEAAKDAERLEKKYWRLIYWFRPDKRKLLKDEN